MTDHANVLELREGWGVRNVSVILGLRPFTAKARHMRHWCEEVARETGQS